jgi:hypothetical protein
MSNVGGSADNNIIFTNNTTNSLIAMTSGYTLNLGVNSTAYVGINIDAWYPVTTNTLDLGATSQRWDNLYVNNILTSNILTSNVITKYINSNVTQDLFVYGRGANAAIVLAGGDTNNLGQISMNGTAANCTLKIGANSSSYQNIVLTPGLITTNTNIIPGISGGYDLGSSTNWWNNLYVNTVNVRWWRTSNNPAITKDAEYVLVNPSLPAGLYSVSVFINTPSDLSVTLVASWDGTNWRGGKMTTVNNNGNLYTTGTGKLVYLQSYGGGTMSYTYTLLAAYGLTPTTFTG